MDGQTTRQVIVAPRPANTWHAIASHASTPEAIACVLTAEAQPGSRLRIAEYHRLRGERRFAPLNRLAISASFLAELAIAGDPIAAARLDLGARTFLVEKGLITAARGSRFDPADWRATVTATLPGRALVRAYTGAMPRLSMTEALPLSVIERDMESDAGGSPLWPGSDLLLRMSTVWKLADYLRTPSGRAVYRLSDLGHRELERAREAAGGAKIGARDVALLDEVDRLRHGDIGELTVPRRRAVARAVEAGWLVEGAKISGTDRRALRVTAGGRAAADRFRGDRPPPPPPKEPNMRLPELRAGMWVRMANRRGAAIGPEWVRVDHVRAAAGTTDLLPGHSEVWVTTDAITEPFLYANRPLFHTQRFERRPQ